MAPEKTGDSFAEEVEDRLENLFGEDEPEEGPSKLAEAVQTVDPPLKDAEALETVDPSLKDAEMAETGDSPLRELKAIVLSIDWEITDEVMIRFVEQIGELQDGFKDDKVVLIFLQLLGSIGEYIRVNLGKSHPEAFKILSSLYNNLDTVVHTEGMPDAERKKILSGELAKYKKLKDRLVPEATPADTEEDPEEPIEVPADAEVIKAPQEQKPEFSTALAEFKQLVQIEMQALRKEIQQLKKALAARK